MRLFLDAHVSAGRIAAPLRERGHDVRSADEERALDGAGDEELLELAAGEGRIMVTFDVADFPDLARGWAEAGRRHAGCAIMVGIEHSEIGTILRTLEVALERRGRHEDWLGVTLLLGRTPIDPARPAGAQRGHGRARGL